MLYCMGLTNNIYCEGSIYLSSPCTWHDGVGVLLGRLDHLPQVIGGDAAHVVVHCE